VTALPADYRVELCVIFWHLAPLRCRGTIPMTTRSVQRASAAGYDTPSTRRRSNLKANGFESVAGERYDRRVPDPKCLSASETGDAPSAIGSRAERHSTGAIGTREREGVALRGRHPDLRHMRRHTDDRISRAAHHFRHHSTRRAGHPDAHTGPWQPCPHPHTSPLSPARVTEYHPQCRVRWSSGGLSPGRLE
jgi:hypothetical protein